MDLKAPPKDIVDLAAVSPEPDPTFYACQAKDCGVRSYYFATINGTELSYCGHHGTLYEVKLLMASHGNVRDLRHTILPTPNVD